MARREERIDIILDTIRKNWKEFPDYRFHQLLQAMGMEGRGDNFYLEDEDIMSDEDLLWGTRGKDGKQPLLFKRLDSLETDHLENILKDAKPKGRYVNAINNILIKRKGNGQ